MRQSVLIDHYEAIYKATRVGAGWTVWEGTREVAWVPAADDVSTDELIQLLTDAIDREARKLTPGALVRYGHTLGRLIAVNGEALVEFSNGDYAWVPLVTLRAAPTE